MSRIQGFVSTFILSLAVAAMGQNLLNNPGFESQGSGWTLWHQSGTVALGAVTYPNTGAHGGSRYARVEVTSPAASSGENWHIQFQPSSWPAQVGVTYDLTFWAKSELGSPIHVSVQGPDFTYLTGTSFGLSTEWTEYTVTHTAEDGGTGAVRFHVYVAEAADVYSFDDFSVTAQPVGIRSAAGTKGQGLQVRQEPGKLQVSLGEAVSGTWKAEVADLRGTTLSSTEGKAGASLLLARPEKSGVYFVRATAGTRAWVRKVSVQ